MHIKTRLQIIDKQIFYCQILEIKYFQSLVVIYLIFQRIFLTINLAVTNYTTTNDMKMKADSTISKIKLKLIFVKMKHVCYKISGYRKKACIIKNLHQYSNT